MNAPLFETGVRPSIVPRDYQTKDHDESYRLWNAGEIGVLTRSATGTGKTLMGCLKIDTWLARGPNQRAMIVSYENQLVWQFAEEVQDFLGIVPGIEMAGEAVDADSLPAVTVASRQSLQRATSPDPEQLAELLTYGINDVGPCPARTCKTFLKQLKKGLDPEDVREQIGLIRRHPEADGNFYARLHKFDWRLNWLLIFDEAHRHAYHLDTVGHIVDWFDRNTESRRNGITATPKRGDGISIGYKMFPGISIDYPLMSPSKPCAVKDGWAVPYVQKYIEVEGVDFKTLAKIGSDFDEANLEKILGEEEMLAKLCIPMLEMVGTRKTLIFSPGVEMAKNVARFINARAAVICTCGQRKWFAKALIGDGATCVCGRLIDPADVVTSGESAREIDGGSPHDDRRIVYRDFEDSKFQFLSVCGLCREGYNCPSIAAVAVFRPITAKCSSMAEQIKGRSCRPLRELIKLLNACKTKEERLEVIAASDKPFALIIDLVGITGLADCASTAQIYAEGLADELEGKGYSEDEAAEMAAAIVERAAEILAERGLTEEVPVEEAIRQAQQEDENARAKVRLERERAEEAARKKAELRAKAGAEVTYTEHDVGIGSQNTDPLVASDAQYKFMRFLGMDIKSPMSKKKAGRIINMLRQRQNFDEIAYFNGIGEGDWDVAKPSTKQFSFMNWKNIPTVNAHTGYDASLLIDAKMSANEFATKRLGEIDKARNEAELSAVSMDVKLVAGILPQSAFAKIVESGRKKRASFIEVVEDF